MDNVLKDCGIAAQTGNPFLDPCTTRVYQGNDRGAHFQGHLLDFCYFFGVYNTQ